MGFFWCKKRKKDKNARNDPDQESEDKKEKIKKKRWWQHLLLAFRWNLFSCCISKDMSTSTSPTLSSSHTEPCLSRGRVALPRRCLSSSLSLSSTSPFPSFSQRSHSAPSMTVDLSSICQSSLFDSEASFSSSYDYDTDEELDRSSSSKTSFAFEPSQHNAPGSAGDLVTSSPVEALKVSRVCPEPHVQQQSLVIQPINVCSVDQHPEKGQGEEDTSLPDIKKLGFPNIGNTCFMNATLQCMLSLSCFWTLLKGQQNSWTHTSSFQTFRCLSELQEARYISRNNQKRKLLEALKTCLSAQWPIFGDYEQQDAHEFLIIFLMRLKEEGESLRDSIQPYICPVSHFEFKIQSVKTCTSCGLKSFNVEEYNHLSINQSSTLTHSLHTYFQKSETELVCKCGEGTCISELQEFYTLPRVLILHVKRFNMFGKKLLDTMDIPPELDLSGFPGVAQPSGSGGIQASPDLVLFPNESGEGHIKRGQHISTVECPPKGVYRLHGVISHIGSSLDRGHYVSDVAEGVGDSWLTFDDSEVSRTQESVVLKCRAKKAYLLFYVHSGAGENNVVFWKQEKSQ